MPDGVINFVPGDPGPITEVCFDHPEFAGVHFTGSSADLPLALQGEVGERIDRYRSYPRLVGETGGKDFVVMHASADPQAVAVALVRGSFEYQGQKCSAASRAYIPDTLWPEVRDRALALVGEIHQGDPADLTTFMGAVIDGRAFARLREAFELVEGARRSARIVCGGGTDDSVGWFVEPTIVETDDPHFDTMQRELFGPCLTVYPYAESRYAETLELCDSTSPYALTGSIFAQDRAAVALAHEKLRHAAGNFYVNDKPTGAVVGAAAVRRRARLGHERQGRLVEQPHALVVAAHRQGDVRAPARASAIRTWSPTARRDGRGRGERRARRARGRLPRAGRRRATGRAHARRGHAPRRRRSCACASSAARATRPASPTRATPSPAPSSSPDAGAALAGADVVLRVAPPARGRDRRAAARTRSSSRSCGRSTGPS